MALLPAPHMVQEAQILEDLSESDDVASEIKYFHLGFGLGIPYHLVLQNLQDAESADFVTSHSLLLKMAVLRVLYFACNVYLSAGDERMYKYFYRILIPGAMYVQPSYFETIAEMFNADDPYRWDIRRTSSPWFSELLEFEVHLFHLISRLVSMDYAKHYNARVQFLQEAAPWHYQYADESHDLTSFLTKYGSPGLMSAFFM